MNDTDLQLLSRYTRDRAEDAFTEIVRRHLNLVYSAALRQVRSPQLAEEVAQSVFADLARNAAKLTSGTGVTLVLTAWLYQVTRRTAIDVVRREARRQLREQIATEMNVMNATLSRHNEMTADANDWTHIEPLLDEAMHALDDTDRAAVLLRYFENKSFREVGATLGTSDDAAQKRVSRAVERLREFFAKRGVTVGASGLVVVITANAVQAAPVGLAVTISTTAALAGTTIATTATATTAKAIAMTTIQKTIVTATVAVLAGAGIYEARQATRLRDQVQTLQRQRSPLAEQIQQLQRERDEATRQLASLREDNERLNRNTSELLKLRGENARLREDGGELTRLRYGQQTEVPPVNPFGVNSNRLESLRESYAGTFTLKQYAKLFADLRLTPTQSAALEDLILRTMPANNYFAGTIMPGDMDPQRAELEQQAKAEKDVVNEQIKQLLGDYNYAQFQAYEKTLDARGTLINFGDHLARNSAALTAEQEEQLVQAMAEETPNFNRPRDFRDHPEETLNRYKQESSQRDQRYVARAKGILSSEQLGVFEKYLTDSRERYTKVLQMGLREVVPKNRDN